MKQQLKKELRQETAEFLENISGFLEDQPDLLKAISKELNCLNINLDFCADSIEIRSNDILDDSELMEEIISDIDKAKLGNYEVERLAEYLEDEHGYKVFQCENLTQAIRVDEFLNELKENPCQLKLIA
jgi:hypothetical protein